jgi:hypothetical protein
MVSTFSLEACSRLPLADASLRLLDYVFDADFLDGVFEHYRCRSYKKVVSLGTMAHIISDSLLGHLGSAHQTIRQAQVDGILDVTVQAAYAKLRRIPIPLSSGMFAECTQRLTGLNAVCKYDLPSSLSEFQPHAFDGKKVKYVLKRLKLLRGLNGNIYGGKLLTVQNMATKQAVAFEATPDGEASDNPLVAGAVARIRQMPDSTPKLWVGDRAFCEFACLRLLSEKSDHFVIRFSARCRFHRDETKPTRKGIDDKERSFVEEWGWLGAGVHRIEVRMISVKRENAEPLNVITSLLDADRYPATDLLILYRKRWGIETMFQQVVQTFGLRRLISGTPQATVFQAAFCLLLYNISIIIRNYVALGAQRDVQTVSSQLLYDDLVRELTGWMKVIGPDQTPAVLRSTMFNGPENFKQYLRKTLGGVWTDRWAKAPTPKRSPKKPPRAYLRGGHSSVHKILRGEHEEIPLTPNTKAATKAENDPDEAPP